MVSNVRCKLIDPKNAADVPHMPHVYVTSMLRISRQHLSMMRRAMSPM